MRARLWLAPALGACGLAAASPAAAADGQVQLPAPVIALSSTPPLTSDFRPIGELRIPGSLSSDEDVRTGVDVRGRPVSVTATQRLLLGGSGDYTFAIPAPVTDVLPGPGTDSRPGFRHGAILWQGFSPSRRVLSARASLELGPAAASLPLAVALRVTAGGEELEPGTRRSGDVELSLEVANRTAIAATAFEARGEVVEVAHVLDSVVRSLREHVALPAGIVTIHGSTKPTKYRVAAELDVEGDLLFTGGALDVTSASNATVSRNGRLTQVTFRGRLADDGLGRLTVRLRGRGRDLAPPRLSLRATLSHDVTGLRPPRGGTWARAVRGGLVDVDGRSMLATAVTAFLRLARTNQYENYLLNPDVSASLVRNSADYVFETAPARRAAIVDSGGGGGVGALGLVAVLIGGVLAAVAALVVWAHA